MKKNNHPWRVATANTLSIRAKAAPGQLIPWLPSAALIKSVLAHDSEEDRYVNDRTATLLDVTPPKSWYGDASVALSVDVKIASASLVRNESELFRISSADPELTTAVAERLVMTTVAQATVLALADAREGVRRVMTRVGEPNAVIASADSIVMMCRTPEQEFAASVVLNQRPTTVHGAMYANTSLGKRVIFGSSIIDASESDIAAAALTHGETLIWLSRNEHDFTYVLSQKTCVPCVPRDRDVTLATRHAAGRGDCKLRDLKSRYAFISSSPSDAKQSFSSIVSVGLCPIEAIVVLDFGCQPMSVAITTSVSDETLVGLDDLETLDHETSTRLLLS